MTINIHNYDYKQSNGMKLVMQQLSEANESDLVEQIYALSDRPEVLGLLIYKLMSERKKTNELIEQMNNKYDALLKLIELEKPAQTVGSGETITNIADLFVPEQDKAILIEAQKQKYVEARQIKDALSYKGLNAASQRLNKLYKEGYLDKKRIGQKVVFVLKQEYK